MDFEFSPEQEELRATVRRFLTAQAPVTPYVRDMYDDERGTTDAVWKGLAELGVTGLLVPEADGGAGMVWSTWASCCWRWGGPCTPGPSYRRRSAPRARSCQQAPTICCRLCPPPH